MMNLNSLFSILLTLFVVGNSYASIHINGAKRTNAKYIEHLYKLCRQETQDLEEITQCMLNTKLFASVNILQENDDQIITVEDRWTLLPLPMINVEGQGNTKYGILILESNFLGWGKLAGVSFDTSTKGSSGYMIFYKDRDFFLTPYSFSLNIQHANSTFRLFDKSENSQGYVEDKYFYSFLIGYRILNKVNWGVGFFQNNIVGNNLEGFNLSYKNLLENGIQLQLKLDNSDYLYYFEPGYKISIEFSKDFENSGSQLVDKTQFKGSYGKLYYSDHALIGSLQIGQVNNPSFIYSHKLGGQKGFRGIYTGEAWADKYSTLSLDYLVPFRNSIRATWTVGAFFDSGQVHNVLGLNPNIQYSSYGVSVYSFLKRIALPGVGLEIGSNSYYRDSFISFTFGLAY